LKGIRAGGNPVDAQGVIWSSAVTEFFCLGLGVYEMAVGRRLNALLLTNYAKSWLLDAAFSLVTLLRFAMLPFLDEPYRSTWARYADTAMVAVFALLLIPVPLGILNNGLREVLLMANADDALVGRVEAVLGEVRAEHDIRRAIHHSARSGRTVFIEIDIVVGPAFALQTVAQQDDLRRGIWAALDLPLEQAWLSVSLTADPRWV
jgi:predicted Co/Zn/Cd cation transporter (cation efflux family)